MNHVSSFLGRKWQRERDCDSPVPASLDHSCTSSVSALVDLNDEEFDQDNPPSSKKGKGTTDRCLYFLKFLLILIVYSRFRKKQQTNSKLSKLSAMQMLEKKYDRKADLKEEELELKQMELELQARKMDQEGAAQKQEQEEKMASFDP